MLSLLRESASSLLALADPAGGAPTREQLSAALGDLLLALERGEVARAGEPALHPAAIAKLGESIGARVASGEWAAAPAELAAVNAWVRARLLACAEALGREREIAAAREATLRALFAAARIVVIELDTSLRFRWVYDAATGPFPNQSIVGRSLFELDSGSAEVVGGHMRRVLSSGVGYQTEAAIVDQEGTPVTLLVTLEPTRDAAGAITGVIGVSIQVTELKKMQEQLEGAVAFRERMMAVLAHDLRNPLSAVRGLAAIYGRKASLPEDVREGLGHIARAGTRMDELIGTLLDFSAARFNGSIPMVLAPADLAEVARGVLGELRLAMPERLIELDARGDTSGRFDAGRVAQLLSNLVSNALTHGARAQPVRVLIEGGAERLRLSVSNAGAPIPPELIAVIFEPFRRGATQAEQPRGLGLGLFIAKQIALGHGGTLEVDSSAERGTVFTLELPRSGQSVPVTP